mmetsp:Transcript_55488/g.164973  ORF Transcript_55488/g.164973 Transcript_55488/m.164973 type:complete len:211 (+) Transcript_55488:56-688(+)
MCWLWQSALHLRALRVKASRSALGTWPARCSASTPWARTSRVWPGPTSPLFKESSSAWQARRLPRTCQQTTRRCSCTARGHSGRVLARRASRILCWPSSKSHLASCLSSSAMVSRCRDFVRRCQTCGATRRRPGATRWRRSSRRGLPTLPKFLALGRRGRRPPAWARSLKAAAHRTRALQRASWCGKRHRLPQVPAEGRRHPRLRRLPPC